MIHKRLPNASLSRIDIERSAANQIEVTLFTAKPGIVIGKGGQAVEVLRKDLEDFTGKKVKLNIHEIKQPEMDAYLVAESIADQLTRRVSYKRAMKQAVQRAMRLGAKGMKIRLGGRLGGAEMARIAWEKDGRVPLHTIRADIDYGQVHAHTTYGRIGVKVWIYKGDVIGTARPNDDAARRDAGRDMGRGDSRPGLAPAPNRGPAPLGAGAPQGRAPMPPADRAAGGRPQRPAEGIGGQTSPDAPAPAVSAGFNNNVTTPAPEMPQVRGAFGDGGGYVTPGPPSEEAIAVGNDATEVTMPRTEAAPVEDAPVVHAETLAGALAQAGLVTEEAAEAVLAESGGAGSQGDEEDVTTPSQAEGASDDDAVDGDTALSQAAGADDNMGLTDDAPGASGTEGAPNVADHTTGEEG